MSSSSHSSFVSQMRTQYGVHIEQNAEQVSASSFRLTLGLSVVKDTMMRDQDQTLGKRATMRIKANWQELMSRQARDPCIASHRRRTFRSPLSPFRRLAPLPHRTFRSIQQVIAVRPTFTSSVRLPRRHLVTTQPRPTSPSQPDDPSKAQVNKNQRGWANQRRRLHHVNPPLGLNASKSRWLVCFAETVTPRSLSRFL